jgi:beta-glucanase (GH16 family)
MDWDKNSIRLYLDDELLNEVFLKDTRNGKLGDGQNPFNTPQYILLNLAVGGDNGGEVDMDALPMKYDVDYVRIYQK